MDETHKNIYEYILSLIEEGASQIPLIIAMITNGDLSREETDDLIKRVDHLKEDLIYDDKTDLSPGERINYYNQIKDFQLASLKILHNKRINKYE